MSTYVLMRILESAPDRYDKGINILSFGKLEQVYNRLVTHIKKDQKVLDIGCGTGALTLKAAAKGAVVKGIDVNPQMLEIARKRADEMNLSQNIELCEMGVAELENIESLSFDVIMSGLCFSELSEDEQTFTLKQINRILKAGGFLLVADETEPEIVLLMLLESLFRIPLKAITWLLTQTTSHAVRNLPEKVKKAGLTIDSVKLNHMKNFIELMAIKKDNMPE
ncbi:MAG TPA: corrinoid protein-associated methyltransferase CpaM [Balneolales bacterium]|nr:corrinoid protein-associated methyltransferase CpaM [Balneolales bacterium]